MNAQERIEILDSLQEHYMEQQLNILDNYYNQLSIYIGVENEPYCYSETLLEPELVLHPLYEPVYHEGELIVNEFESLQFQLEKYTQQFKKDEEKKIENIDLFQDKLDKLKSESEILKQKNDWQIQKNEIHDDIFKQKMVHNDIEVKKIKTILNSDFYNDTNLLSPTENETQLLDALEKVIPIYEKIILKNKNVKVLKNCVIFKNSTKISTVLQGYQLADEESINDFLYLWKIKNIAGSEVKNNVYKTANHNNLLFYSNKNGWSDTAIVNEKEDGILVDNSIIVIVSEKVKPQYLLLLLNLPCYRNIAHYNYHRKNNPNSMQDFLIPIPSIEVQNYFSEAVDRYFYFHHKKCDIGKIIKEATIILKEQGEVAANFFLDLKILRK